MVRKCVAENCSTTDGNKPSSISFHRSKVDDLKSLILHSKEQNPNISENAETTIFPVTKCGLFIDTEDCYLAASPYGLIGTDTIIEVKCPANSSTMLPEDAIMQKKVMFANLCDNEFTLKRQHVYYYQVQGQLHVTKRLYCYFVFWTPLGMLVGKITRDDDFWSSKMSNSLELFYFDCLLPEIIDPQLPKNLPIKNPEYRRKI